MLQGGPSDWRRAGGWVLRRRGRAAVDCGVEAEGCVGLGCGEGREGESRGWAVPRETVRMARG